MSCNIPVIIHHNNPIRRLLWQSKDIYWYNSHNDLYDILKSKYIFDFKCNNRSDVIKLDWDYLFSHLTKIYESALNV